MGYHVDALTPRDDASACRGESAVVLPKVRCPAENAVREGVRRLRCAGMMSFSIAVTLSGFITCFRLWHRKVETPFRIGFFHDVSFVFK